MKPQYRDYIDRNCRLGMEYCQGLKGGVTRSGNGCNCLSFKHDQVGLMKFRVFPRCVGFRRQVSLEVGNSSGCQMVLPLKWFDAICLSSSEGGGVSLLFETIGAKWDAIHCRATKLRKQIIRRERRQFHAGLSVVDLFRLPGMRLRTLFRHRKLSQFTVKASYITQKSNTECKMSSLYLKYCFRHPLICKAKRHQLG